MAESIIQNPNRLRRISQSKSNVSVSADSFTDVTFTRSDSGTFMCATFTISGSANVLGVFNSIGNDNIVVRLRNYSASTITVTVSLYYLVYE